MIPASERFDGKVVFVTGAGNGIGRAAALAFARQGARVVAADIAEPGNEETAQMIRESGGQVLAVRCNVTRAQDVKAALDETVGAFGGLDIAFNNAGIEQETKAAADITEEEWDRVIAVDLRGVFVCMKYEIPLMLQRGGGAIVNTSSGAGVKAFGRGAAYAAAKHGVVSLTRDAALDYAPANIRINAVCPGITDTKMIERVFGGTAEGHQRIIARNQSGAWAAPKKSPPPSCGCAPTTPPSSSGTPWSSTAAERCNRSGIEGAEMPGSCRNQHPIVPAARQPDAAATGVLSWC